MSIGVVYVVSGDRYVEEALFSAATLKKVSDLPVTLFSDCPVSASQIDSNIVFEAAHKRPKVEFLDKSPYSRTIYLDSDTQVMRDISQLFNLLDRFDIAAVHDHSRKERNTAAKIPEYGSIDYAFPEYNSGVIVYSNDIRMKTFFDIWKQYYYKYADTTAGRDQPSFRIALWKSDVRLHTLPFEFNIRCQAIRDKMNRGSRARDDEHLTPRIHHWHGVGRTRGLKSLLPRYKPMKY